MSYHLRTRLVSYAINKVGLGSEKAFIVSCDRNYDRQAMPPSVSRTATTWVRPNAFSLTLPKVALDHHTVSHAVFIYIAIPDGTVLQENSHIYRIEQLRPSHGLLERLRRRLAGMWEQHHPRKRYDTSEEVESRQAPYHGRIGRQPMVAGGLEGGVLRWHR